MDKNMTLLRSPFKTLYYFGGSVGAGLASAATFVATHPVTLYLALPAIASYVACKGAGAVPDLTEGIEVGSGVR